MKHFPEYQDIFFIANIQKGGLPCIVSKQDVTKNISLHHHDFMELGLVLEGEGTEIINGEPHPIKPGTATFLLPHHLHEIHVPQGERIRKFCCMFDISILFGSQTDADLGNLLLKIGGDLPSFAYLSHEAASEMKSLFEKMQREFQSDQAARNSYVRALLVEALVLYVRSHHNVSFRAEEHISTDKPKLIWNIIQYVNTHYMYNLSLELLSQKFNTSKSTISQSFKEEVGQSFLDYVHQLKIRRACGLLLNTDMSIVEIAEESGFASFRTFSRVFKRIKGMTASEFRKSAGRFHEPHS